MEILGCIGSIVVLIASVILNGWVLSVLWDWFITSTFDAPSLGIAPAIGIAMVVSFLTDKGRKPTCAMKKKTGWEDLVVELLYLLMYPLFALGAGWIIYSFM